MEAILGPRAAVVNRRLEMPVLVSALAVLPLLVVELVVQESWLHQVAVIINSVIWAAFALEFTLLISLTEHRLAYVRRAWLHLSVIPFAFPLLPYLLSGTSLEAVFRTLRFVVLVAVFVHSCRTLYEVLAHMFFDLLAVARHPWLFIFGPLVRRRGLGLVVLVFWMLAMLAGLLHSFF